MCQGEDSLNILYGTGIPEEIQEGPLLFGRDGGTFRRQGSFALPLPLCTRQDEFEFRVTDSHLTPFLWVFYQQGKEIVLKWLPTRALLRT